MTWPRRACGLLLIGLLVGSCSPYAGLDVGRPFNVDTVTINPDVGIGFPLEGVAPAAPGRSD